MTELKYFQDYFLRASEKAALEALPYIGSGKKEDADQACVKAYRDLFNESPMNARIVIGEGERDKAPMLYIGEKLGQYKDNDDFFKIDIAIDPLEGTSLTAKGQNDALCVVAFSAYGGLLHSPDIYMDKIAVNNDNLSMSNDEIAQHINLENTPKENFKNYCKLKDISPSELKICVLKRERHENIVAAAYDMGAKVFFIDDGDVSAIIRTKLHNALIKGKKVDMYLGSGGAPEGVLAACALRGLGGFMQGKLLVTDKDEEERVKKTGIKDGNKILSMHDLAPKDGIFIATGVTNGALLDGIKEHKDFYICNSLIIGAQVSTVKTYINKHE